MIADILTGVAAANLAAGAAVLAVLGLRSPVRGAFGARAAYALWLAPLAAGLAVLAPHPQVVTPITPIVLRATQAANAVATQAPHGGPVLALLLLALWLTGAAAAAVLFARRQAKFVRALGRLEPFGLAGVYRAERSGVGPAVIGVLNPKIVAPADFEARFGMQEQALVLAHEGAHLKSGDAAVNGLACAAQCLCWFNPLIHLGVRALRVDQELACDAAVIGRFPAQRRLYAELLLKTQLFTQPLPLGCHWPAGAEHPLKERIVMLKSPMRSGWTRGLGSCLAVGVGLLSASLAWAAHPAAPTLVSQPIWMTRPTVTQPIWVTKPTGADIVRLYPAEAVHDRLVAHVTMTCRIGADGKLAECGIGEKDIQVEGRPPSPADQVFGTATLELAKVFRMAPASRDGVKVAGGTIRIPVIWRAP